MALHTPVHPLPATHHPHALRNALIVVLAAIAVVALVTAGLAVRITPFTSTPAVDPLVTQQQIEFRAGERAAGYPVAGSVTTTDQLTTQQLIEFRAGERALAYPAVGAAADPLLTPQLIEFRAEERSVGYPEGYNGPH